MLLSGEDVFLRRFLSSSFPGRDVEIINCGMAAYDSRRILSVFAETLEYEPDLAIVLSGNNESGRDFCPDFNAETGRRARKIKVRLASLSMPPGDAEAAVSLEIHEERLRAMAALARKKGTPVLFCTLPANLRDFAPAGNPPENIGGGIRLLSEKKYKEALEFFGRGVKNSREPFSLFYAGRALEGLGRTAEAAASYAAAVKYDSAMDRCSGERNAMIRRVAAEEGACLADLEAAFSGVARDAITGGAEMADGSHWFKKYSRFLGAVIGRAAGTCGSVKNKGMVPAPEVFKPRRGAASGDDFSIVLSYACAYARDRASGPGGAGTAAEREIIMLERLCRMDCGRLERLLLDGEALDKELRGREWNPVGPAAAFSTLADEADWRAALLRSAAEMFLRAGRPYPAARLIGALTGLRVPAGPAAPVAKKDAPVRRPLREGEAEGKRLSDLAVTKMRAGDLDGALPLLVRAAEKDGGSLEIRLNACFLAAGTKNVSFGERHCGEAILLAAYPPKHALPAPEGLARAFHARAAFRLETGNKAGCGDLRSALEKASPGGELAARVRALAAKHCAR